MIGQLEKVSLFTSKHPTLSKQADDCRMDNPMVKFEFSFVERSDWLPSSSGLFCIVHFSASFPVLVVDGNCQKF